MDRVLLVEDTDSLRDVLRTVLENEGFSVDALPTAEEGIEALRRGTYSCVLADFKLPGKNGIELLAETRNISSTVPFVIMTAFGSIDIAVQAMKLGANDFISKPFEPADFCRAIHQIIEHRRIIDRNLGTATRRDRKFLTAHPTTLRLLEQAKKVARVDSPVLILGESGTGKELIARHIHEHSPRRDQPFVAVNCAALPPDLLESEFFGHEAGAFTGATQTRIGVFEYASEGTIFLDEVGDMPAQLQVKLLRALQQREVKRIGSNKTTKVNPRVISATNHQIEAALSERQLREDFYYRIAVVTLTIPPLRERPDDIPLLIEHLVRDFSERMHRSVPAITPAAMKLLQRYPWQGNGRELENVIERAVILSEDTIDVAQLGIAAAADSEALDEAILSLSAIAGHAVRKAEIEAITRTLNQTQGNKSRAAQILGVSYKTLLNKVKEYEIQVQG